MPKNYTNINGQSYDAVTPPASGRKFREAWTTPVDGVVQVDLEKAKELHREAVRRERRARWEAAGGPFGPAPSAKEKNVDRDPRIDSVTSVEELEALTYDVLVK